MAEVDRERIFARPRVAVRIAVGWIGLLVWIGSGGISVGSAALASERHNQLSEEQKRDGWILLFDGESLDHWRGFRMEGIPAGWSVADGRIRFAPPAEGQRADLITRDQFESFELELEWAVTPGANSGVFFHVSEDRTATYHTGPEMQVLDDDRHRDGQKEITSAGSNYALHPPVGGALRRVGEFNQVRLKVDGDRVQHWLNGKKVVDYRLWTDDWKAKVAASKFASMPGYGLEKIGHIALQDHGDEIWFRNLKIRRLQ